MKFRIYYEDTDAAGIVYHSNYIKFCERARSEAFFNSDLKPFSKNGYFVVTQIIANFKKPAVLGDMIEVKTKVKQIKKASATLSQEIYKIGNLKKTCEPVLLFNAEISVAFMVDDKPSKMPDDVNLFLQKHF